MTYENAYLEGKAMWASVHQPNTTYEPKYQVDLLLDADNLKKAEKCGLRVLKKNQEGKVKYKDEFEGYDGSYIKPEMKESFAEEFGKPKVVDSKNNPVPEDTLIGNGSDIRVKVVYRPDENYKKEYGGYKPFLAAVQVINLVEYQGGDTFDEVDGFTVEKSQKDEDFPFDDDLTMAG